jgi:hypothetical protein
MQDSGRLVIAPDATDLVRRHAAAMELLASVLGQRLRDQPVAGIRIERAHEPGIPFPDGLVVRVLVAAAVEEAQHLWELIEQDINELQQATPADQRRALAEQIAVVVEWQRSG